MKRVRSALAVTPEQSSSIDWNKLPILATSLECAAFLGRPEQQLRRWRNRNLGPCYIREGRTIFYRRIDVRHWYENRQKMGGGS